jgi:hypothetical protein
MSRLALCALIAALAPLVAAGARDVEKAPDCFDVLVLARPISQTPAAIPECDDCFIMSWPWILELDVEQT